MAQVQVSAPPGASQEEYDSDDEDSVVAQSATKVFGQHVAFDTEILARQYRAFLLSVSMVGSRARLLRWDRSGYIITESFDIREPPDSSGGSLMRRMLGHLGLEGNELERAVLLH
ncbi:hypothetical protein C8Q80DRAFT_1265315 [Daedaleopsis nitida]|nr:hypothetical protein C8Q80DRAFT_1265315 [Daedaleopsis nitida]